MFARTHDVNAKDLRAAIRTEQEHRQLPRIQRWECPSTWEQLYPRRAVDVLQCRGYETLASASALMSRFLDPLLADAFDSCHDQAMVEGPCPARFRSDLHIVDRPFTNQGVTVEFTARALPG